MRTSSDVLLGAGTVGGRGALRGLPGLLLAGSCVELVEAAALLRPLRVSAATAAAQKAIQVDLAASNANTCLCNNTLSAGGAM